MSVKKGMRAGGLAIAHRRSQARVSHHIHQYAEDVRASILPKLGAYPPQKQLAAALREVGRLRRRGGCGLGEAEIERHSPREDEPAAVAH